MSTNKMKITRYSFGKVIVDGHVYTTDVIIYPDHIDSSWWRKEGHCLFVEDINKAIMMRPAVLIIGTGYAGSMTVPEETREWIRSKGIEVQVMRTEKAIELFNNICEDKRVVAALHLTC